MLSLTVTIAITLNSPISKANRVPLLMAQTIIATPRLNVAHYIAREAKPLSKSKDIPSVSPASSPVNRIFPIWQLPLLSQILCITLKIRLLTASAILIQITSPANLLAYFFIFFLNIFLTTFRSSNGSAPPARRIVFS